MGYNLVFWETVDSEPFFPSKVSDSSGKIEEGRVLQGTLLGLLLGVPEDAQIPSIGNSVYLD